MSAAASTSITRRTEAGVLELCLDRPEKKNALTRAMYTTLAEALTDAGRDDTVGAVLLEGRGGFCAGNDLNDFIDAPPGLDSPVLDFLLALHRLECPLVAAVSGPAVGIGTTMLLHCDLVYCAPDASFRLPFVALGLCPEAASSLLLPERIGARRAAEMLLLNEPLDAETAAACGLVNAVVAGAELSAHARARARQLAAQPRAALRTAKRLLKTPATGADPIAERLRLESERFRELLQSEEAQTRLRATLGDKTQTKPEIPQR